MFDKYCWINRSVFAVSLIKWGGFRVYKLPFEKKLLGQSSCLYLILETGHIWKDYLDSVCSTWYVQFCAGLSGYKNWPKLEVIFCFDTHPLNKYPLCRNLMGAYTHEVQLIGPLHETYLFIAIWAITFNIVQIYTLLWSFDYGHWGRISWRLDFIFCWFTLGCFLLSR